MVLFGFNRHLKPTDQHFFNQMAEENLNPNEEPKGKPGEGGEPKVVSYEDFQNLQKGVEKLAAKLNEKSGEEGKGKEGEGEPAPKPGSSYSSVVKKLYLKENPEIETVWDEVAEEAQALGQDPIDYYESKKGWQLEAKARAEAERKKQETKDLLDFPEGKPAGEERIDFSKIKPEQIAKLTPKQRESYREFLRGQNKLEIKRVE